MKSHMSYINIILTSLLITFLSGCNQPQLTEKLKEYKIISSIEDREFLPNQIKKTFDWGYIIRENRVYKIANKEGKILTQDGFKWMPKFSQHGIAIVENPESKYGLINTKGEYLLDTVYEKISDFNDFGLAIVSKSNPYTTKNGHTSSRRTQGLIDIYGKFKIKPKYFNITYIEELDIYKIDHHSYQQSEHPLKESLFSTSKESIKNITFDSIGKFINGFAIVSRDSKKGVINKHSDIIIPLIYKNIYHSRNGTFKVVNNKKTAFFNNSGNIIKPFKKTL